MNSKNFQHIWRGFCDQAIILAIIVRHYKALITDIIDIFTWKTYPENRSYEIVFESKESDSIRNWIRAFMVEAKDRLDLIWYKYASIEVLRYRLHNTGAYL